MLSHLHTWYHLISHGGSAAAVIGFILIVIVSFLPVLPIPLIAAAVGAVDPLPLAIVSTWLGACAGALAKFFLERLVLRRPVHHWLGRYRAWQSVVAYVERHGFYAVLVTRLIPVFPSSVVNTAGAVTGISKSQFVIATLIGKLPTMVVFTVAGSQLTTHFWGTMAWLTVYGVAVAGAVWWLQRVLRSRVSDGRGEEPEG
ncbi:TVP38/TMEM64 family protein [Alicyclobacillus sp. ALC3]|uniref:TVP38/TMEM64 family protein n=1 Tax=Alicyclobacillus sp. ALC3 TaxID=2796143 RepID=UPI0023795430|nr:TVP38/TMEM64 family protein [Alicyclobacillus sp. ALC3]WDL98739.1 TVP38/TMEM64 family protein [Alicyclobacillus sp. ALC3]